MPAISVRDIEVKDDASCLCSDLVAGTHGRGFWILDDVTPLRQAAEAAAASNAYLFKPATGIRIRFGTNDPTPWPPELPAGENPPPGALVDYYLPADASGEVKLEVLNAQGKVIRTYSSNDPVRNPDPATDPVAYNKLCQQTPTAPDCSLPLYWPAPPQVLKTTAGMHRFSWDMHYDPIPGAGGGGRGGGGANGAVPHRTYPGVNSPWVAPGTYTVRLTANGKSMTPAHRGQDGSAREDHAGSAADLHAHHADGGPRQDGGRCLQGGARAAGEGEGQGRNRRPMTRWQSSFWKSRPKRLRPPAGGGRGGRGGFGAAAEPPPPPTLANIGAQLVAAVQAMQGSEMPPTAAELHACSQEEAAYNTVMAKWAALKAKANGTPAPAAKKQ